MKIEIVIPILNEERTLRSQIVHLLDFLEKNNSKGHTFTVTIADNGSTDQSGQIGREIVNSMAGTRYLKFDVRGVGRALKKSWTESDADIVGFMDLDFATDLKHLDQCWEILQLKRYDIVCGSRNKKDSHVINRSFKRTVISKVFNSIIRVYFQTDFTDGMCGFKFIKRDALPIVLKNGVGFDDWFFSAEILIVAEYMNLSIYDLPVTWTDDRNSKVEILELTKQYLVNMKKLKLVLPKKQTFRISEL